MTASSTERIRVHISGTVQGVGFRPFVYRRAVELGLAGHVGNDSAGVVLEVEGSTAAVAALLASVRQQPPLLATVEAVHVSELAPTGEAGFLIAATVTTVGAVDARVSADVAPCDACLAEMADPDDRRFGYPFINCTDCGPRYTIVRAVPYDRASTTMAGFVMCGLCQAEYDDPSNRRFHAQPNACSACGPSLAWEGPDEQATGHPALAAASRTVTRGGIVALKGVGGYHLACDATSELAVRRLRERKCRPDKPFAVMVADADAADVLCQLDRAARAALVSGRRPVIVAPRRAGTAIVDQVAPRLVELGVMLPSSPLHVLLVAAVAGPLVMTSGNRSDEPLGHQDEEARERLGPLVEGFLTHDRPIQVRTDDSVLRAAPGGRLQMVRRARGWVPQALRVPVAARVPVLAVGAQLKSTVAIAKGSSLAVSQHLGDLDGWDTYRSFTAAIGHLTQLSGALPAVVAHDLHPDYRSTAWAVESRLPLIGVQHHHAHIAACLTENGCSSKVLGIAFDGTGFGTDGTAWGGEFLLADLVASERVGRLVPVMLPGGDTAVREPWRMALAWLHRSVGPEAAAEHGPRLDDRWSSVLTLIASGRAPETSSVGRLFDAVAALLSVRSRVTYEGQAAVELEALARQAPGRQIPTYEVSTEDGLLDPAPMLAALLSDLAGNVPVDVLAAGFHRGLAQGTARLAVELSSTAGVDTIALSGGVFQNALLTDLLAVRLREAGLRVLLHEQLPPHDGCVSVGQASVAAARLQAGQQPA